MPGGLEQLHMMSLQLPIPDFTLIYDLCKEYKLNKKEIPKIESLEWKLFNVKKIEVKFKDVDCGQFEEKRQELITEINKQGDVEMGRCSKHKSRSYQENGCIVSSS
eukprot:TRINITY_DN11868_c0_g1_i1.p1 TRINITY_DN11868_c0_g1~~TRINITY_DN11868_c0_g1_i1.p1  ORF type:complete len:106 (-),score=35.35 TRINITY_DN11868_c0_g1_i1:194-511(-)